MLYLDLTALRKLASRSGFYGTLPSDTLQRRWRETDAILDSAEKLEGCLGCSQLPMFYSRLASHLAEELAKASPEVVTRFREFVLENLTSNHKEVVLYYRSGNKAQSIQI